MNFLKKKWKELKELTSPKSTFRAGVVAGALGVAGGYYGYLQSKASPYNTTPTISVIALEGSIGAGKFGNKSINLESTRQMIDDAFKPRNLKLVCLKINSPGGSAVQSDLVSQYIKIQAARRNVDVVAFVEDTAASGGYWLACGADKIYAARSSFVGSIGVIVKELGFHELIKKYGIESRVFTAGENKLVLDPLSPLKESDVEIIKTRLSDLHEHFIEHVKTSRGDRLKADDKTLFNGEVWTGQKALELGLVDGIDTIDGYIKREYGKTVRIFRVKQGGFGLSSLFSAYFQQNVSTFLSQLAFAAIGGSLQQHSALGNQVLYQEEASSLYLDQQSNPGCALTLEDPTAFKISQENLKMK
eukprot:TRINITY_DN7394_c0_g1_i11.p1 TRINITY_DN7394_c0_g1~~TRINITY_DN7394_c0_g1_i11.p1  ORF type:complete len:359 (-),score=54.04 TRINITY_DN7394_c0_g1_i11:105-1181(-)